MASCQSSSFCAIDLPGALAPEDLWIYASIYSVVGHRAQQAEGHVTSRVSGDRTALSAALTPGIDRIHRIFGGSHVRSPLMLTIAAVSLLGGLGMQQSQRRLNPV